MSNSVRKIYINSPVFTREDEERYQYVDTEVGGLTEEEEDGKLESLINGRRAPQALVRCDWHEGDDQTKQDVCDSIVRDSLEDDMSALSNSQTGIVVADPSRYEDLRATDRHADIHQARGNGRSNVKPKYGNPESQLCHYYSTNDDAEEYEETQLERQHQRQAARRAHVPHLELSHSDDEPCTNGEGTFDLEIDDGRGLNALHQLQHSYQQKNASNGNRCRVSFGALPRNSDSADSSQLTDSLEAAQYHPSTGVLGGNPNYERSMYTNHQTHSKNEPRGSHNNFTQSHLSVDRSIHPGDTGHYHSVPVEDENCQDHVAVQNSSAKRQQSSSHSYSGKAQVPQHSSDSWSQDQTLQTSNVRSKPVEGTMATDFVEANRLNVSRKAQKTYGQIYSRKKVGKENTINSDQSASRRPVGPVSSMSAPGHKKVVAAEAFSGQDSRPANRQGEESDVLNAEQLWHTRSRWLAARKESAEKNGRSKDAVRAQNKVTRDVRVNDSCPVMSQASSSVPRQQQQQQYTDGSLAVPMMQSEMSGILPQKVSVDINLNVLSPRRSLNQPMTLLPQEVYQYSSRTQEAFSSASGQYHHPAPSQPAPLPAAMVPQSTAGSPEQYTVATVFPSHSHSAPQFVSSGHQLPTPRYFDAHGHITPNQAAVGRPQHLPIRYNYAYPQPSPVPVSDTPPRHLYHMEVCSPLITGLSDITEYYCGSKIPLYFFFILKAV